ncbi:methyltransferase domain-containing protein [Streptomyces sp. NPDC047014]|uniref:methyltransferase domain-containing protein n=1 Tax=Streptomyces sp. NPDC047014 TaxID=3155736 RepID=UPI003400E655
MATLTRDPHTHHSPRLRPDERIARYVAEALGDARSVLNVGPGALSYETPARTITSLSPPPPRPPHTQRHPTTELPFHNGQFDGALMLSTLHQWPDTPTHLRELRRVTRGPVVILTHDPLRVRDFWLYRYAPEVLDTEALRHPPLAELTSALGGTSTVTPVPIPLDCTDGFNEAYYGRPELLLDPAARQPSSAWSFADDRVREHFDTTLRADLESGTWDTEFAHLRHQPTYEGSLVLLRATP